MISSVFEGLFFGYIHFHAGPCCRPRKYWCRFKVV